jgi:aryl-alcohol dehydrogenase-like predicted oxidoreductase
MRTLGRLGPVSALSFGGGGIGGVYGSVAREEAIATVRAAVNAGITAIDLAPRYGPGGRSPEAELVVGEAFDGRLPRGVLLTSKVMANDEWSVELMPQAIRRSLAGSLKRLRVRQIDLFLLHSYVRPSDDATTGFEVIDISSVRDAVRPTFESLVDEGLIRDWGLTGVAHPDAICDLLEDEVKPAAIQCVTNVLDTVGEMWPFDSGHPDNGRVRTAAVRNGVAVMGIRAAAAGALADTLDRPAAANAPLALDYRRAKGFRDLAKATGISGAQLAYRYTLSLPDVATVIVGAKTRRELAECISAEAAGPLTSAEMREVEAACSLDRGVSDESASG